MGRARVIGLIIIGIVLAILVVVGGLLLIRRPPPRETPTSDEASGTSVVVLVDFSKSFAVSKGADGRLVYGLQFGDKQALKAVAGAVAELASRDWTPPLKTVWTQIQTSSVTADPLCKPLETIQKLVKSPGEIGTRDEIEGVLRRCVDNMVQSSSDVRRLSAYTDISGAIAMASDFASGEHKDRVIVMVSDFNEDLAPRTSQAAFHLKGERVVLIHRPGTDEPENIAGYLARVNQWKKRLLENGASAVATLPVFAVSQTRLRAALLHQEVESGTSLTVLVDFKDNVLSTAMNANADLLARIGNSLAKKAGEWPSPVSALWMAIGPSGFTSQTLPPLEFGPSLIKRSGALNTVEQFGKALDETARALPGRGKGISTTDISGSLALACSIDPPTKAHVLVIISDFVDGGPKPPAPFALSSGTRVVMLHKASLSDRSDPNAYAGRRRVWEQRFRESGATSVCQIPLVSFTAGDLDACLTELRLGPQL